MITEDFFYECVKKILVIRCTEISAKSYKYDNISVLLSEQGMDDIKYNFLIDEDGVIYEGRGFGVIGQHTVGKNSKSLGNIGTRSNCFI